MIKSLNNLVCCTPFQDAHVKSTKVGHVALLANKMELECLTVLVEAVIRIEGVLNTTLFPGNKIWVRGENFQAAWAKPRKCPSVLGPDGKEAQFILVPYSECVFVENA